MDYAIDVNTGAHQETDTLEKNGIAVCEILLTEGIVADLFSNHKVLGELILIDRVTNMTSACGVVDAVSEKVSSTADRNSFQYGDLKARGDIFEEFYYDTESLNVLEVQSGEPDLYSRGPRFPPAATATTIRTASTASYP